MSSRDAAARTGLHRAAKSDDCVAKVHIVEQRGWAQAAPSRGAGPHDHCLPGESMRTYQPGPFWHDSRMPGTVSQMDARMRSMIVIAAVAALFVMAPAVAEEAMDREPINRANARLVELQKNGDAAGMAEMYTEDAILLPAGSDRVEGRKAIEAFWRETLGSGVEDVQLTTETLVAVGDDLAYEIGRYTTRPRDAAPVSGQYLVLWKRAGNGWRLHVDIFNEGGEGG